MQSQVITKYNDPKYNGPIVTLNSPLMLEFLLNPRRTQPVSRLHLQSMWIGLVNPIATTCTRQARIK